jgi:hypothetical protein
MLTGRIVMQSTVNEALPTDLSQPLGRFQDRSLPLRPIMSSVSQAYLMMSPPFHLCDRPYLSTRSYWGTHFLTCQSRMR